MYNYSTVTQKKDKCCSHNISLDTYSYFMLNFLIFRIFLYSIKILFLDGPCSICRMNISNYCTIHPLPVSPNSLPIHRDSTKHDISYHTVVLWAQSSTFVICFCCFTNNFKIKISLKHKVPIRSLSKKRNPLYKFLYNINDIIITTCFLSTRIKLVDTPSFFLFSARIYKYASLERCASHVCIHIFRLYGSIKQLTIII